MIVLVHEMWHGLTTLLFGAGLEEIIITWGESGETVVNNLEGSVAFLMAVSAGYLGSTLTGAILLNRGLSGKYERLTLLVFAGLVLYISLLFTRVGELAFGVGMAWSLVLFIPALASRFLSRIVLIVLGTLFVWYCLFDMFDFTRDIRQTDAGILAIYAAGQGWVENKAPGDLSALSYSVSIIWCLTMLLILYMNLKPVFRRPAPPATAAEAEPELEPGPQEFPGEVTPEIQDWFLSQGLGPDGQPLPPELLELQNNPLFLDGDMDDLKQGA